MGACSTEADAVFVSLGALDDADSVRPEYHQYTADAASWHRIADDLPRHPGWPES